MKSSTWAGSNGCSARRRNSCSPNATAAVPGPAARTHPPTLKRTTSAGGTAMSAAPTWTTASCSARIIITGCTRTAGTFRSATTCPGSAHRHTSTRPAHHDAADASATPRAHHHDGLGAQPKRPERRRRQRARELGHGQRPQPEPEPEPTPEQNERRQFTSPTACDSQAKISRNPSPRRSRQVE